MTCGIGALAAVLVLLLVGQALKRARLMRKYGDRETVQLIMRRAVWQGQTPEQVRDSIGRPLVVDRKVHKAKVREA